MNITDTDGATATATSNANVAHGTLSATSQVPTQLSMLSYCGPLASFSDTNKDTNTAHFSAAVNWGDGTTTAGNITLNSGNLSVYGSHTYPANGSYPVQITITNVDSSFAIVGGTVTVATGGADGHRGDQPGGHRGRPGLPHGVYVHRFGREYDARLLLGDDHLGGRQLVGRYDRLQLVHPQFQRWRHPHLCR